MRIESIVRTTADLLLLLLVGVLVLQLFAPAPEPRIYQPPSPIQGVEMASPESATPPEDDVSVNHTAPHSRMEKDIFDLVNLERGSDDLDELGWDDALASVARKHSQALAKENGPLTERDLLCYIPFVHHEGFESGLYHEERLYSSGIYHFSASGENIFLASAWKSRKTFDVDEANCSMDMFSQPTGAQEVKDELEARIDYVEDMRRVKWLFTFSTKDELNENIVEGWMESEGHKKNILHKDFTHSGIGIAQSDDFFFVTQIFIAETDCGYKDGPCCKEEGFYPFCYVPYECSVGKCS